MHGWLVDPQDKVTAEVVSKYSYNQLMEKLVLYSTIQYAAPSPSLCLVCVSVKCPCAYCRVGRYQRRSNPSTPAVPRPDQPTFVLLSLLSKTACIIAATRSCTAKWIATAALALTETERKRTKNHLRQRRQPSNGAIAERKCVCLFHMSLLR